MGKGVEIRRDFTSPSPRWFLVSAGACVAPEMVIRGLEKWLSQVPGRIYHLDDCIVTPGADIGSLASSVLLLQFCLGL